MRKTFLLIENPAAGRRRHALLRATIAALAARGANVETRLTEKPGHAAHIAREAAQRRHVDAVIAAGGDGSIREVAKGLLGTSMPLGVIPNGTGNVFAFELGLPRAPGRLADYLETGKVHTITPSLANGEPFLLMAGVGFDATVVAQVNAFWKQRLGKVAFTMPILRGIMANSDCQLRATLDGMPVAAAWFIATHASRYAGRAVLTRGTGILQGRLELIGVSAPGRLNFASLLTRLAIGRLIGSNSVTARLGTHLEIDCDIPVPVQIDGDLFGTTPLRIAPGTLTLPLIVPQR